MSMADPAQIAARSEVAASASSKSAASSPPTSNLKLWTTLVVAGLLTGGAIAAVAGWGAGGPSYLQMVARADLDQAAASLPQQIAAQAAEEARQCKTPLPYVTLQTAQDTTPNRIRIRSGNYTSPWLLLNGSPQRIAVPFPAPYPTGKGELFIEGATRPVTLWLKPAVVVSAQTAPGRISVMWNTSNPCPH
jgi:hypothetical protein